MAVDLYTEIRWKPCAFHCGDKTKPFMEGYTFQECYDEVLKDCNENDEWSENTKFILSKVNIDNCVPSVFGMEVPGDLHRYFIFYDDCLNEIYLQRGTYVDSNSIKSADEYGFRCIKLSEIKDYIEVVISNAKVSTNVEW